MRKEKNPYIPVPQDVPAPDLSDIYSESQSSNNGNSEKTINSHAKNTRSLNNANISRTNLIDTELIDLNADGDADESKYNDLT